MRFDIALVEGTHSVRAESLDGAASFEGEFEFESGLWAILQFWTHTDAGEGTQFTWQLQTTPWASVQQPAYDRGNPRPRVAIALRFTSLVPPATV